MSSDLSMTLQGSNVIQAHDLGKCYKIYDNPKARLKQALWGKHKQYYREFWALRNVSFEVKRGESLGIIGRNGSGKSTLLQLLCGTLTPTEGNLKTQGRIAALLELGSGFNPEFTGLENVYLNASLLGLKKEETDARLAGVLAFADIGDFINQPVKSYSSGMTVRLAFAVIAHVNPDILVVDEALAVGDAIFVQRCMRFIRRMREEKCLLFVSHDSETVKNLCSHALWLSNGKVQSHGNCKTVCLDYLHYCNATSYGEEVTVSKIGGSSKDDESNTSLQALDEFNGSSKINKSFNYGSVATPEENLGNAKGWRTGAAELISVRLCEVGSKSQATSLRGGELVEISISAKAKLRLHNPIIGFSLKDRLGQSLFGENTYNATNRHRTMIAEPGDIVTATFRLWMPMLQNGDYALLAAIADETSEINTQHHWLEDAVIVRVSSSRVRHGIVGAFISSVDITKSKA